MFKGSLTGSGVFWVMGGGSALFQGSADLKGLTVGEGTTVAFAGQTVMSGPTDVSHAGVLTVTNATTAGINVAGTLVVARNGSLVNGGADVVLQTQGLMNVLGRVDPVGKSSVRVNGVLVNDGVINGPVIVGSGGVMKGSGIFGAVNVGSGGEVSPGNSPGEIQTGAVTWGEGGRYVWEVENAAGLEGVGYDHWAASGVLSITAGFGFRGGPAQFVIEVVSVGPGKFGAASGFDATAAGSWELISAAGVTGFDPAKFLVDASGFGNSLQGGRFSVEAGVRGVELVFTPASALPEPSVGVVGIALGAMVGRRRR